MTQESLDPTRWSRRAKTIPAMLGLTAAAFVGFPVLAPITLIIDALRGRFKWPTLRLYLFLLQYGFNDSVEILLSPLFWLLAGFGKTLDSPRSIARHERLQWWSVQLLERRAAQLLGLHLTIDETAIEALRLQGPDDPIIILSRHVSLFDASLPGLLAHNAGRTVRGVIMAELLADPGFDLLYGRLGSVFVPRDDGPQARKAIAAMANNSTGQGTMAVVIFPEGRLFTTSVRDRSMTRLAERDPQRATRLQPLSNLLPPKSGGLDILLDALPTADIVLLNHSGLDSLTKLARFPSQVPAKETIHVTGNRITRDHVPEGSEKRKRWLDELWLDLDDQIAAVRDGEGS